MSNKKSLQEKWISEAAYFKSLERTPRLGLENRDWLEAEQEYKQLIQKRVKSGLVIMN